MTRGSPDRTVIERHLEALDTALSNLVRHQGRDRSALEEADEAWIVERGLQLCAQNALDIATHLAAAAGREALDYRDAIEQLGDLGALPREFAERFRDVAGFRNRLVHGYLALDTTMLHRILNDFLDDFRTFATHVLSYLDSAG